MSESFSHIYVSSFFLSSFSVEKSIGDRILKIRPAKRRWNDPRREGLGNTAWKFLSEFPFV